MDRLLKCRLLLFVSGIGGMSLGVTLAPAQAWREVFDPFQVLTLNLQLNGADWNRIRNDVPIEGSPELNETAEALFWASEEAPITVSIRRKSATAPTYPSAGNPQKFSMKIDFNAVVPGQDWRGLRKISLEVGQDDPFREGFTWNLHRLASDAGIYGYEAGYAAWVKVYVNGDFKGVFINAEQKDKRALQNRGIYKSGSTWLYKIDASRGVVEVGIGDSPTYNHLCYLPFVSYGGEDSPCPQPDLEVDLPRWVHVQGFLTLAAIEAFVVNGDGLFSNDGKNSYAADFFPPNTFKRMYFPWDHDSGNYVVTGNIYEHGPGSGGGDYQTEILEHPWFKQVYQQTIRTLLNGPFSETNLHAFIDQLQAALEPSFNTDPYIYGGSSAGTFTLMKDFVTERVPNVWSQIADPFIGAPTFNQHGGEVISGFQLTMSAPTGMIYYTLDGADPRGSGGVIAPSAMLYAGSVVITETTRIRARAYNGVLWSAFDTDATFNLANYANALRITEIMYHPADEVVAGDGDDYEFITLKNTGSTTLDLSGYFFDGIGFIFDTGTTIGPEACFVLARDGTVFSNRYPAVAIHGEYGGKLANSGEKIRLKNSDGNTIISVDYDDEPPWPLSPDGLGYSLVNINLDGDPDNPENWRASANVHGSPCTDDPTPPYGVGIVINEVLTHTDPPYEDAIELYNPTISSIDVSGWFISDDLNPTNAGTCFDLKKYKIPPGTLIPAGGFTVFYQRDFDQTNPLVPFAFGESGDQAYLASADGSENLNGYIVGVEFGAVDNARAIGRYQTSVGIDFTALMPPTFGVTFPATLPDFRTGTGESNAPPKVGPIVINEIMYNPTNGGAEFIELHNITTGEIDITDWDLAGTGFVFPNGTVIAAGSFLVLVDTNTVTADQFRSNYNIDVSIPILGDVLVLQNDGESLRLEKPNATPGAPDVLVDRVRYNDKSPWPTEADGEGPALERFVPELYGNDPINWRTVEQGGSPGRSNLFNAGIAIVKGSSWKYHASGANLGAPWRAVPYADSSWPDGDGPLGYGNPAINTVVPFGSDPTNKHITTYFRKDFVINDDPALITNLLLRAYYDDAFVLYLNGVEVLRSGLPATGTVTYTTLAASNYNSLGYETFDLTASIGLLSVGHNVLAVEVHQVDPASADLMWDADLTYDAVTTPTLAAPIVFPNGGLFTDPIIVTISNSSPSAAIYYTLDGLEPDMGSTLYTTSLSASVTTIFRAHAFEPGFNDSPITTVVFTHLSRRISFATASSVGSESNTHVLIEIVLNVPAANSVSVSYGVTAGTIASGGADYVLADGVLTLDPDQTSSNLSLVIQNDTNTEPDEVIEITLSNAVQAVLGIPFVHVYTILDDERDFDGDGIPDLLDLDDDNDGIPDVWEIVNNLNPTNAADAALDGDNDEQDNLTEFITDFDPTVSNTAFRISRMLDSQVAEIFYNSSTGRLYSLEVCPDLGTGSWSQVSGQTNRPGSGGEDQLVHTNAWLRRSYRIEVTVP